MYPIEELASVPEWAGTRVCGRGVQIGRCAMRRSATYLEEMASVDILVREVKRDNRNIETPKDESRIITKARAKGTDSYTRKRLSL